MKIIITAIIVMILLGVSFVPMFSKQVKSGTMKINAWDKIMILLGVKHID